jgi:polar amino acid transport system substrate-binding protein
MERALVRNRPALQVVQEGITDEKLGVAVRLGNDALRQAIDDSQARLRKSGVLGKLTKKWLQT